MQHRRSLFVALRRSLLLSLLPAAFAACDRHPAGEPPEAYGHGSSHQKSYYNHAIDSSGPRDFSDTVGADANEKTGPTPGNPEPASAGKRLNPEGH